MSIRFQFDSDKAVHAIAYLVAKTGGRVDKAKLFKLLYIAEREHYLVHGRPITGDRLVAMKYGPLPSTCLDLLNGLIQNDELFRFIEVADNLVILRQAPPHYVLDDEERATLDSVVQQHGRKQTWDLVEETHEFPEYAATYQPNTSRTIPYELIAEHHGDERRYRHNRTIISANAVSHVLSPFDQPDSDL